jgi:hypothetical protein
MEKQTRLSARADLTSFCILRLALSMLEFLLFEAEAAFWRVLELKAEVLRSTEE